MSHGTAQVFPNGSVVHSFPFAYNTEGLATGYEVGYVPAVGDILLDAWIEIDSPWNGATPKGDLGSFVGGSAGILSNLSGVVDMTVADAEVIDDSLISQGVAPISSDALQS